jgi:hypothetical protein
MATVCRTLNPRAAQPAGGADSRGFTAVFRRQFPPRHGRNRVDRQAAGRIAIAVLALTASCAFSTQVDAQVIPADAEPAPTIDVYPGPALNEPLPAPSGGARLVFQLSSSASYSSNVLGVSNLPGGLELDGEEGVLWDKGAAAVALVPIGSSLLFYATAGLSHTNYFDHSALDHFTLQGGAGLVAALSGKTFARLAVACSSERDSDFHGYYELCRPSIGFSTAIGNPDGRTGLELGATGALALGDRERFGQYREASAYLRFETGGALRFMLRPEGRWRQYDAPAIFGPADDKRTDYQAEVRAALFFRSGAFTFGIEAAPRVNWSDFAQYRYWEVQGGPYIRVRI